MKCFICGEEFDEKTIKGVNLIIPELSEPAMVKNVDVGGVQYQPCQKCLRPFIFGCLANRSSDISNVKQG